MPNILRNKATALTARMPLLFRLLGGHLVAGLAIGMAFSAAIISSNTLGLRDLIAGTEQPAVAVIMLVVMNALTFGSLSMGIGVMTLPLERPEDFDDDLPPPDRPDR